MLLLIEPDKQFLAIVHTLYFTPLRNTQEGISNRLGLVQEVLNLYFAGLINNITLYPFERNLFYQEYRDGIYGVTEFGLSYLINELPTEVIPCFFGFDCFACGLPRTPQMFLQCLVLGLFLSTVVNH